MKLIRFDEPGPPSVLQCVDVPIPEPKPGEVLIRAHAIGVGIPDTLIRAGTYGFMPRHQRVVWLLRHVDQCLMSTRVVVIEGDHVTHALLAYVGQRHRRSRRVLGSHRQTLSGTPAGDRPRQLYLHLLPHSPHVAAWGKKCGFLIFCREI